MRAWLSTTAFLAGCGATSAPAPHAPRRSPPASRAETPDDGQQLRKWADRMCACDTTSCADDVVVDVENAFEAEPVETFAFERTPGGEDLDRLTDCTRDAGAKPYFLGTMLVRRLERLENEVCACDSARCVLRKGRRFARHSKERDTVPLDAVTSDDLEETKDAWGACMSEVSDRFTRAALASLEKLRQAACDCSDTACADEVEREHEEWLADYVEEVASDAAELRVERLSVDLGDCLASARGETSPP